MLNGRYTSLKVEQVRQKLYEDEVQRSSNFGEYALPEKVTIDDSERGKMSQNMKDFVIISKKQRQVEQSIKNRDYMNNQRIEKNRQMFENHQEKAHENSLKKQMDDKQLELRLHKAGNNVILASLKRLEKIQIKREITNLKK